MDILEQFITFKNEVLKYIAYLKRDGILCALHYQSLAFSLPLTVLSLPISPSVSQKKLSAYSKMQECVEQQSFERQRASRTAGEQGVRRGLEGPGAEAGTGSGDGAGAGPGKDSHPPEYLSSRCVLFTYFHGDIGDVVDEHFSRALSQPSAFSGETKPTRTHTAPASASIWKGKKT